jgi:hypothetical protein
MKQIFWLIALALPVLAIPSKAQAWLYLPAYKVDLGAKVWCNVQKLDLCPSAPWYTYFPYDPHLASGHAGPNYPFWPQTPAVAPQAVQQGAGMPYAPVSYAPQAPGYWYGQ